MAPHRVVAIRRYPVKSMGGEPLESVRLERNGIEGDRAWAVVDEQRRFASGKRGMRFRVLDGIFGYRAWSDPASEAGVRVARERRIHDGAFRDDPAGPWNVDDPDLVDDLRESLGADVHVERDAQSRFYDDSSLSLIGTATVAWAEREFGVDAVARRLRANVVVATDEPFEEESWVDGGLAIGDVSAKAASPGVRLGVARVITRCRMIDLAQDGVAEHGSLLQPLTTLRGPKLAVYCVVLQPGTVSVGDAVEFDW